MPHPSVIVGVLLLAFALGVFVGMWAQRGDANAARRGYKTAPQRPVASVEAGACSLVPCTTITLGAGWDDESPSQRARRFTDAIVAAAKKGPR